MIKPKYALFALLLTGFGCGDESGSTLSSGAGGSSTGSSDTSSSTNGTGGSVGATPTVTVTSPADAATGAPTSGPIQATFSVLMDPATISGATFTLMQGTTPVAATVTYAGMTATLVPASALTIGATFTATITAGAKDLMGHALAKDHVWTFKTGQQSDQATVDLGAAGTFAILAFNTVTNVNNPGTVVTGDLGISPGASLVGFPPGQVVGTTHAGDPVAAGAKDALLAAYNNAVGRLGAAVLPGDLSGLTFSAGLYKNSTSVMIASGSLTLDANGDSSAVFIFQIGSTLTTNPGTQVLLAGGAKATNIFWAVGTSATLGTNSKFKGTLLTASALTMKTGASLEGRLLAQAAAVALDTNLITVPLP